MSGDTRDKLIELAIEHGKRNTGKTPGGLLAQEQAERFAQYVIDNRHLLKRTERIRLYPWWQIPIRETIGRLAWWLKFYAKRWEYAEADEVPWRIEWVEIVANKLERLERILCGGKLK